MSAENPFEPSDHRVLSHDTRARMTAEEIAEFEAGNMDVLASVSSVKPSNHEARLASVRSLLQVAS